MKNSIDNLIDRIKTVNSPLCIELNGDPVLIPNEFKANPKNPFVSNWVTTEKVQEELLKFNKAIIDLIADKIAVVSIPFYPYVAYGERGIRTFTDTIKYAKSKNIKVICDIKICDDVMSTQWAMSAFFSTRPSTNGILPALYDPDMITFNPYSGYSSFIQLANVIRSYNKGMFATIMMSSEKDRFRSIDHMRVVGSGKMESLYYEVAKKVHEWTFDQLNHMLGEYDYYPIGFTMMNNLNDLYELRKFYPNHFMMIYADAEMDMYTARAAFRDTDFTGAIIVVPTSVLLGTWKGTQNTKYIGMPWYKIIEGVIDDTNDVIRNMLK